MVLVGVSSHKILTLKNVIVAIRNKYKRDTIVFFENERIIHYKWHNELNDFLNYSRMEYVPRSVAYRLRKSTDPLNHLAAVG